MPIATADAPPALTGEQLQATAARIHRELRELLVHGGTDESEVVAGLLRAGVAIDALERQLHHALPRPGAVSRRAAVAARRSIREAHALVAATCCSLAGHGPGPGSAADRT